MTVGRDLHVLTIDEVKRWAERKGLAPGKIRGTKDGIQLVRKGGSERVEVVDWEFFEETLQRKGLAVYSTKEGWMRIMRRKLRRKQS